VSDQGVMKAQRSFWDDLQIYPGQRGPPLTGIGTPLPSKA